MQHEQEISPAAAGDPERWMDPDGPLPAGELMQLQSLQALAPLEPSRARGLAAAAQPKVKPPRPPKDRLPVATRLTQSDLRNPGQPPAPPSSAAPSLAPAAPPAVSVFRGGADNGTAIPPDTAGAVSRTHLFNPLNNSVTVLDRQGTQISQLPLDTFWSGVGVGGDAFDPVVIFDPVHERFVFVSVADARQPTSAVLVAVSRTGDPTGNWSAFAIQVDDAAQGPVWMDYPTLGHSADKVTIQVNLFTRSANRFAGSTVYALDKSALYAATPTPVLQRFVLLNQGGTQAPAITLDGNERDQYLVARWAGDLAGQGSVAVYRLTGDVAAGQATLTRVGFVQSGGLTWASFPPGDFGPQQGQAARIDVGDDRILGVVMRNGMIHCCHTVMLPAQGPVNSGVQWWVLNPQNWPASQVMRLHDGTGALFHAFPTLAVNGRGDVLTGHATFSAQKFASASWHLRPAGGGAASGSVFAPGLASYFKDFGSGRNRWGDYSATQVDPANDLDFWTVQAFADSPADRWATMWARVAVSGAPGPTPPLTS